MVSVVLEAILLLLLGVVAVVVVLAEVEEELPVDLTGRGNW